MDRRESLKASAFFAGSLLMPSFLSQFFQSCNSIQQGKETWKPLIFSAKQAILVPELVDTILPATDTPGAKEAMTHVFIDLFIKDCYPKEQRDMFLKGLDELEAKHSFLSLDAAGRTALLTKLEKESIDKNEPLEKSFIKMAKKLTILGYFTSEIGATKAAEYIASPGPYIGCIDLKPDQKVTAHLNL